MENKTEMKELNLNEMSNAAGGSKVKNGMRACSRLKNLIVDIYKKLFVPTETLD